MSYTIPETILGAPLFVPTAHDYFSVESGGMPDGADCIKVHGSVSRNYKAFLPAPIFPGLDFMHTNGSQTFTFSMSCWLKIGSITPDSTGKTTVMLGCSNANAAKGYTDLNWTDQSFLLSSLSALSVDMIVHNSASTQNTSAASQTLVANTWGFYVFATTPASICTSSLNGSAYAGRTQGAGGFSGSTVALSNTFFHIGAYSASHNGRPGDWYIGKLAFHNHVLSTGERDEIFHENADATVTINKAVGQPDPATGSTITFSVEFSQIVTGFGIADVTLSGTAGATTVGVSGTGTSYIVTVSGMTTPGTVVATIPAGIATTPTGGTNTASTSTDNSVAWS